MRRDRIVRGLVCAFYAGSMFTGCLSEGGLNQNEREAGGGDEGVAVEHGEIAIDPTGQYLISKTGDRLIHADLGSAEVRELTRLSHTARVSFSHDGASLFVTRGTSQLLDENDGDDWELPATEGQLVRYELGSNRIAWSQPITLSYDWSRDRDDITTLPWLDVTEDDRYVIATESERVIVIDAASGEIMKRLSFDEPIVDVDVTPDQDRIVVTTQHTWTGSVPRTELQVIELATFQVTAIQVPNCASELSISANGQHAFLAPTHCQKDPVSVIDLDAGRFVRNLPGFGPVALAANGALAVAFIDASNIDASLFDDPQQIPTVEEAAYHLMLIDTESLRFDVIPLGDRLPRYAITPDGKLVLIDADTLWEDGRVRMLDVTKKELFPVLGPGMQLDHYAVTSDSSKVFLLDDGLYTIDLTTREAGSKPIDFTPTDLNLTPDDSTLVLREDDETLRIYDTRQSRLTRTIHLSGQ